MSLIFYLLFLTNWREKVDPELLQQSKKGTVDFWVVLTEQADLSLAEHMTSKQAKGRYVFETLRGLAEQTQAPVVADLAGMRANYQCFWVANMILVRNGDADMVVNLAQRTDVARLERNPAVQHTFPRYESPAQKRAIEWNLIKIAAPDVWNAGFTGQDVVVGGQDTGYDWDHPAIKNQYLGWNGASVDHNYHWHDAIHSSAGPCPGNSLEPCDDHGHGTHTMGTAVGSDGGANQIGVAPGARWIGCRNMDQGNGTPATYSECFQWFIAPTDMNDLNPDPNRAPDVLINSWGCPTSEGCSFNSLKTVVDNVRAAGIVVVVSAGNSGSSCSTINDPPAIYASSFTVASTTNTDGISSFSSRGPVTVDGSNRLKPDIAAPGSSIRSSVAGGSYTTFSGTSMAGPHVSGLVALLLSAEPNLKGNVDAIEERIRMAALPLTSNQVCSGFSGMDHPNIVFGYGRIQAPETVFGDPCAGISSFADWMQGLGGNDTNGNGRVDIQEFLLLDSCLQN